MGQEVRSLFRSQRLKGTMATVNSISTQHIDGENRPGFPPRERESRGGSDRFPNAQLEAVSWLGGRYRNWAKVCRHQVWTLTLWGTLGDGVAAVAVNASSLRSGMETG